MDLTLRELPYALETCSRWHKSIIQPEKYDHHLQLQSETFDHKTIDRSIGDVVWIFGTNCSGKTSLAKRFLDDSKEPEFVYSEDGKKKKILISKYGDSYGLGAYTPTMKIAGLDTLMSVEDRYLAAKTAWLDPKCKTVVIEGILNQYMTAHIYNRMLQCIQPRNIYYVFLDSSLDVLESRLYNRSQKKFADLKNDGETIKVKYYSLSRTWMAARKFYDDTSFDELYNQSSLTLSNYRHFYLVDTKDASIEDIYRNIRSEMDKNSCVVS